MGRLTTRALVPVAMAGLLTLLLPGTAEAHVFPGAGDFFSGMLHPVTALEMLLPMVALGGLAGQQGREAALRVMAAFPLAILLGGAMGATWATGIDASLPMEVMMVVLGVSVAGAWRLPLGVTTGLALLLGLCLGIANGAEIDGTISGWRFLPGVALAGLLCVAYILGLVRAMKREWTKIAVRVVGSWVAAAGIMVLALRR